MKIYHRILPEEEAGYRSALLAAYQAFRSGARPANDGSHVLVGADRS